MDIDQNPANVELGGCFIHDLSNKLFGIHNIPKWVFQVSGINNISHVNCPRCMSYI